MDNPKLTPHKLRSIQKQIEAKENRAAGESPGGRRGAPKRGKRSHGDWDEDDDAPDTFEKFGAKAPSAPASPSVADLPVATVVEARGKDSIVTLNGETWVARLSSRLLLAGLDSPIVAGDEVRVARLSDEILRIDAIEPRSSVLARVVDGSADDPIAANVDLVLLVVTPDSPPFRPGLVDRYMVASAQQELAMAVCLNKVDLGVSDEAEEMLTGYAGLGIGVVRTSTLTGEGIGALRGMLENRITVFTGHSGVGKSSLLNAVEPGLSLRTGEITQATAGAGKGTHTTTSARLVPLSIEGAFVVDSPGIRAFGVGPLSAEEVALGFPDVTRAAEGCRMRGCAHNGEPGCAVEAERSLTAFGRHRLASYRSLVAGDAG